MELGTIDRGMATFIAACIAAIISILTFFLTLFFNRKTEIERDKKLNK